MNNKVGIDVIKEKYCNHNEYSWDVMNNVGIKEKDVLKVIDNMYVLLLNGSKVRIKKDSLLYVNEVIYVDSKKEIVRVYDVTEYGTLRRFRLSYDRCIEKYEIPKEGDYVKVKATGEIRKVSKVNESALNGRTFNLEGKRDTYKFWYVIKLSKEEALKERYRDIENELKIIEDKLNREER